jgi:hypothetical protein
MAEQANPSRQTFDELIQQAIDEEFDDLLENYGNRSREYSDETGGEQP